MAREDPGGRRHPPERPSVQHPSVRLGSGLLAEIVPDRFVAGAFELVVDGTPQSHVDLGDPRTLFFEYVQRMGHVIDRLAPAGEPITAVHLGAGALTIPRYVHATRPGSRQQVIELERPLVDLVRAELPLPRDAAVRVRYGDARAALDRLPAALESAVDLVVVDVFAGARTPAHVTTVEFYRRVAALLAPSGVVLANIADGPGLGFARGQAATLAHVFGARPDAGTVAVLADAALLRGRRYGNVVLAASPSALPLDWLPRLLAAGPHPARVLGGRELSDWVAGAAIVTDATAVPSPPPQRSVFQTR
ncbi:MAG: fused MFS/spermidine synthase [Microbacteriaceae bacterium]